MLDLARRQQLAQRRPDACDHRFGECGDLRGWAERDRLQSVLFDREGLFRAAADGFLHLGTERLVRVLVQDLEHVVVVDLEHGGLDPHAHRVALAQIAVDEDPHSV